MPGQSPLFNFTTTGIGKETGLGIVATPTLWLSATDVDFHGTNEWLERMRASGSVGRDDSLTGAFGGTGAMTLEADPDLIGPILAFVMGTESIVPNAGNPTIPTGTPTLTAPTAVAAIVLPFSSVTGYAIGNGFRVDAGLRTQEDFVILSIATLNVTVTAAAKFAHLTSAAIAPAALAYDHTYVLSIPRPSFTVQQNRRTDIMTYLGNKAGSMTIALQPKALVTAQLSTSYVNQNKISSGGSPVFSILKPFRFIDPLNTFLVNGAAIGSGLISGQLSLNTGLQAPEVTLGGGRQPVAIPEAQSKASASLVFQFVSREVEEYFNGAIGSNGPLSEVGGVPMAFFLSSGSTVNGAVHFGCQIILPNAKITTAPVPGKSGAVMQQTATIEAYGTVPMANDDIKFVVTNANSAAT